MNFNGLKIRIIIVVTLIVLGLLFGGRYVYERFYVLDSLVEAFTSIEGASGLQVKTQRKTDLVITLDRVSQLETTYGKIKDTAEELLGDKLGTIQLVDRRDQQLVDCYHRLHYALWQAISTGDFVDMAAQASKLTEDLDARITVDRDYVYVELETEEAYLYEIVPRQGAIT